MYTNTLTLVKGGLVTFCALMVTIMHKHGGIHEWDLTLPEVHEAIYASLRIPGKLRRPLTDLQSGSTLQQWCTHQLSWLQN